MKEVTITGYCDGDHDDRVLSVVERTVAIDGSKPVLLDLCGPCDKAIEDMLTLMERGAVVDKPKKSGGGRRGGNNAPKTTIPIEGPHVCPECGQESVSRGALGQHLNSKHGKGFRDYAVTS